MIQQSSHNENDQHFDICIRQHPQQARMCGLLPKVNRRKIDPPLIIQVKPSSCDRKQDMSDFDERYLCHLSLVSSSNLQCDYFRDKLGNVMNNVIGESVIKSTTLLDPISQQPGLFFVYHDISIRLTGKYRLTCNVIDSQSGVVRQALTRPFEVFTNKRFPGNSSRSLLSEAFLEQGVRIRKKTERAE